MEPEEDLPAGALVLRRWGPVVEASGLPVVRRWMSWGGVVVPGGDLEGGSWEGGGVRAYVGGGGW